MLAGAGLLAPAHASTGACGASSSAWSRQPLPASAVTWVAPDDTDGCHLTAGTASGLYLTLDGGHDWTRSQLPSDGPITGVWSEGLGHNVVMASAGAGKADAGGLLISTNGGLSFQAAAAGLQGFRLIEARSAGATTAATSNGALVYLLASRSAAALLFVSTDSGSTFLPQPETQAFAPTVLAVDPADPQVVWLNSTANTGSPLWLSTDGGRTFSGKTIPGATAVADVWLAPRKSASSLVYAATNAGVFSSADAGATWRRLSTASSSNVRTGRGNENAVVALAAGRPVAGSAAAGDAGSALKPWADGVPASCAAGSLAASGEYPSAFTQLCADGRVYRRLSDADRSGDAGDVSPPSNNGGAVAPLPLVEAQTWPLPGVAALNAQHTDATSATLAYDGVYLYYLPIADQYGASSLPMSSDTGIVTIARINAATGQPAPDIKVDLGKSPGRGRTLLDYDSLTRRLLINTARGAGSGQSEVLSYDLATGAITKLFPSSTAISQTGIPYVVSDNVSGGYVSANEGQRTLYHLAAGGHRVDSCDWQTPVGALAGEYGASGLTFTGDGGVYVELEDDQTVYRLDSNCRLVQAYLHRLVSEAAGEDDELACDGQSFALPAVWLRDAAAGIVTAYLTPGGFCPLPSTMTVTAPSHSPLGKLTSVCAQLRTLSGAPAVAKPVALDVDGAIVGFGPTDTAGEFCAPYRPATPGLKTVDAQFFGSRTTPQLLGAAAQATIAVPGIPVAPPPAHRPPPPPKPTTVTTAPDAPSTLLATGPSVSAPGQPPPGTNQVQQVQSQPGTSAQTAISTNEEQQQQLAFQTAENDGQFGLERSSNEAGEDLMMMSAAAMLGVAAVLRSRHRRQLALDRLTRR
jgi:hypothetical protein